MEEGPRLSHQSVRQMLKVMEKTFELNRMVHAKVRGNYNVVNRTTRKGSYS